jgi:hypothetical protein
LFASLLWVIARINREKLTPVAIIARVLSGDVRATVPNHLDVNGIAYDVPLEEFC